MNTILYILIVLSIIGIAYTSYTINKEYKEEKARAKEMINAGKTKLTKKDVETIEDEVHPQSLSFFSKFSEAKPEIPKISKKENKVKITQFDSKVAKAEKGKKQTHIGNVREVRKKIGIFISKISKKDLLEVAEKYNGKDLLTKIVKKLK